MVISKQFDYDASITQINGLTREQLKPFVKQYLSDHSYFKTKDIALKYLYKEHQLTFYDLSAYNHIIGNLTRKIGKLLRPYKTSGVIEKYNSMTYQIVK